MKRLLYVAPFAIFAGLAALLYSGLEGGPPSVLPSPLVNKPAPDIALPALDNQTPGFARSELGQGKPIIVNFFSSWCAPCRVEHPALLALSKTEGVEIYGVDYKEALYKRDAKDGRAFLTELGSPYSKIDRDDEGSVSIDWGVTGVPETFVIDAKGIIRVHYAGPLDDELIRKLILPALKP